MISPHYGYLGRGAESFTREITKVLKKRGHTVDIYGMGSNVSNPVEAIRIDQGIGKIWSDICTKTQIDGFFKKFIGIEPNLSHLSYFLTMSSIFKDNTYDFLWNNGEMFGALFCFKIRKRYNIPFIVTFHGNESMMMLTEAKLKPDIFAVLTPQYKNFLGRKIEGNIKCIPNGIDLTLFKPNKKKLNKYGLDKLERPLYLSTSALTEGKRVELAVKAIARLKKGSFVFTQTGPEQKRILVLAKKLLKNRFKWLGSIPFKELPALYNTCDVYINTSRSEGHSLALMEAMACNLPIVTHNDENRKWSIGEAGYLVDVTNIKVLAKALLRASKKDWKNIPRKQAEKFSWDKTVDVYLDEMERVNQSKKALPSELSEN